MKKTYISPEIKACEIGTATVIAQSLSFNASDEYAIDNNDDIGVKEDRGGFWDDEW